MTRALGPLGPLQRTFLNYRPRQLTTVMVRSWCFWDVFTFNYMLYVMGFYRSKNTQAPFLTWHSRAMVFMSCKCRALGLRTKHQFIIELFVLIFHLHSIALSKYMYIIYISCMLLKCKLTTTPGGTLVTCRSPTWAVEHTSAVHIHTMPSVVAIHVHVPSMQLPWSWWGSWDKGIIMPYIH